MNKIMIVLFLMYTNVCVYSMDTSDTIRREEQGSRRLAKALLHERKMVLIRRLKTIAIKEQNGRASCKDDIKYEEALAELQYMDGDRETYLEKYYNIPLAKL